MNTKPDSLQSQLIRTTMLGSILAGLLAFLLLISIAVYHAMQVHDEIMDELADTLLVSDLSANSGQLDELSNEFDIQYQLNWQGKPISPTTTVTLTGEVDIDYKPTKRVEIDVDSVKF